MGCGSSVPVHQAPLAHRESDLLHTSSGKVPTASVALLPDLQQDWLRNPKWTMLKDWCGWHSLDQFGFKQPTIESIVGKGNGRSILGGVERPHDYQVAVSFPGATFVKGELGTYHNLTDADGNLIATNGAEMAEALRHWLVDDWLEGCETKGLTHVFIDKCNLQYCEGSVRAEGFGKKDDTRSAVAVLNENWAIYLREAFLEAKLVIFLVNSDWMDSVPCNLEFEGLVKKKRGWNPPGSVGVAFIDISDSASNAPSMSKYLQGLTAAAGRYFDVHCFKYNEGMSPEEKRAVRNGLKDLAARYCTKHDLPDGLELQPKVSRRLNWANWIYYGTLDGTNGWRPMAEVDNFDWEGAKARGDPDFLRDRDLYATFTVPEPFPSRRFRLRVTRLCDGSAVHILTWALYNKDTGENIVDFGKGFIKARGELGGVHPAVAILEGVKGNKWVDRCGSRQYSWIEWLVPDGQPPVTVDKFLVVTHAGSAHERPVDFVLEAMTLDACPQHGDPTSQGYVMPLELECPYDFFPEQRDHTRPQWTCLHSVQDAALHSGPAGGTTFDVPPDTASVACSAFRVRFLEVAGSDARVGEVQPSAAQEATVDVPCMQLRVTRPSAGGALCGVYPVGGGIVSGSGGQEVLEESGATSAFDDHKEHRWIDAQGGGLDGNSWWQYEHPEPFKLAEYGIRSSINTMGFHNQMHASPRDWVLKARTSEGDWIVVDRREEAYFSDFRQLKRFKVQQPVESTCYRFEFSAVRCGCASDALVVGDIYLLAPREAAKDAHPRALQQHEAWVTPSMHLAESPGETIQWSSASTISLRVPAYNPGSNHSLEAVAGGTMRWLGETDQWYDCPMEFALLPEAQPTLAAAVAAGAGGGAAGSTAGGRTWSGGTMGLCGRPRRVDFEDGEIVIGYTADCPLVLGAYSLTSQARYQRGDPRSWRLEARVDQGDAEEWRVLHKVDDFTYETMCQTLMVHLPGNTVEAQEYRFVVTRMYAPSPHIATTVALFQRAQQRQSAAGSAGGEGSGGGPMCYAPSELASMEVAMRPREGKRLLHSYTMTAGEGWRAGAPRSWVVEGLTSHV